MQKRYVCSSLLSCLCFFFFLFCLSSAHPPLRPPTKKLLYIYIYKLLCIYIYIKIEFDAVALNGRILNFAISEHVENAGVHSGDATLVLPAQKLYQESIRRIKKIGQSIAYALCITGPFNIQLLAKENEIKVIECNLRASRTFPFVSKTLNANFITLATKVSLLFIN